jgi:hypothetical protein
MSGLMGGRCPVTKKSANRSVLGIPIFEKYLTLSKKGTRDPKGQIVMKCPDVRRVDL